MGTISWDYMVLFAQLVVDLSAPLSMNAFAYEFLAEYEYRYCDGYC